MTAQREEWRRTHVEHRWRYAGKWQQSDCLGCHDTWPCSTVSLLAQLDEAEVREGELRAALEAVNPGLIADRVLLLIKEATEARDAALAKGKP